MRAPTLVIAAVVLGSVTPSAAGTLSTPLMIANGSDSVVCIATNVGKADAEVAVSAKNVFGGNQNPVTIACPNPLPPGATCQANFGANVDAACFFEVKGKVKASINLNDATGNRITASLPATK